MLSGCCWGPVAPADGPDVIHPACDRDGYEGLSALLSATNIRGTKAAPVLLHLADLARLQIHTALLLMPPLKIPMLPIEAHFK